MCAAVGKQQLDLKGILRVCSKNKIMKFYMKKSNQMREGLSYLMAIQRIKLWKNLLVLVNS